MHKIRILVGVLLGAASFVQAFAAANRVELPIQAVYAPVEGFDDNDTVEAVITGVLPNACYSLLDTEVHLDGSAPLIELKQFAMLRDDGPCVNQEDLPYSMRMQTEFSREVSLGMLPAQNYELRTYPKLGGQPAQRPLRVEIARAPSVDTLPYVTLISLELSESARPGQPVEILIWGTLNSSCATLDPEFRVIDQGDVLVVLPTFTVEQGKVCTPLRAPWSRTLKLPAHAAGTYLIHSRSQYGKSLNRLITVSQ